MAPVEMLAMASPNMPSAPRRSIASPARSGALFATGLVYCLSIMILSGNLRPCERSNWFVPFVETYTNEALPWAKTPAPNSYPGSPPLEVYQALIDEFAAKPDWVAGE